MTTTHIYPLATVHGHDTHTPLVSGESRRYINLDYAASTPALTDVVAHLNQLLPYYASVHRGAGYHSQISTSVYESARNIVRKFVHARPDDTVIFTRNTTDSLNLLASCLPAGGDVVYLDLEHHANLLPWQSLPHRSIPTASTRAETLERIDHELHLAPAALLAVTGASNVTGEVLPIAELAAIAHRHGSRIVVDAAQLAPHRSIDLTELDIDYLAFSGHKLYAPFGAGVLIGKSDWLDAGPPYLAGGGAVRRVHLDNVSWTTGVARHEAGSPNVLGAASLAYAAQWISKIPENHRQTHEVSLRQRLLNGLDTIDGVQSHQIFTDSAPDDSIGVVNFSLPGYDPGLAAAILSAEYGVGVRDGLFCAHPLLRRLGLPSGSLRASFGLGSSSEDIDRLLEAVSQLLQSGPRWDYTIESGRWIPTPDPRPFPEWAPKLPGTAGASPCQVD